MSQQTLQETARSATQQESEASPEVMEQVRRLSLAIEQQQAEIVALRAETQRLRSGAGGGATAGKDVGKTRTRSTRHTRGSASSRRALLKWGGAAAAAATVALVASGRQSADAAAMTDGSALTIGQPNTTGSRTALVLNPGTLPMGPTGSTAMLVVDGEAGDPHASGLFAFGLGVNPHAIDPGIVASVGGFSNSGNGVFGASSANIGIVALSGSNIDLAAQGTGRFQQNLQSFAGAPTTGTFRAGEMLRDKNGDLWLCVAGNGTTLGAWKKVAAIPSGTPGGALVFFPAPFRVYDTRPGVGAQGGGGPMSVGQIITVPITGVVNPANNTAVPPGATGIIGDLIAITPSGPGFLGIQPSTGSNDPYAWVNFTSGVTIHNSVVVGLSPDGKVDVQCSLASSGMGLTITGYII